ncbi:MAG: hypothetical protein ACRDG5_01050 [Anaerolineales bacterium]
MDEKARMELTTHINDHVGYPISKSDFMASCGNLSHVPDETREWVGKTLPDRTYQSAEDVSHALNLPHAH